MMQLAVPVRSRLKRTEVLLRALEQAQYFPKELLSGKIGSCGCRITAII
ncbi:hypothetical protein KC976_01615 [Candidatus Saccharibacteria bacterium]|nr:hypothetical protein [Candidatus Saccharibacteria bacterium]